MGDLVWFSLRGFSPGPNGLVCLIESGWEWGMCGWGLLQRMVDVKPCITVTGRGLATSSSQEWALVTHFFSQAPPPSVLPPPSSPFRFSVY